MTINIDNDVKHVVSNVCPKKTTIVGGSHASSIFFILSLSGSVLTVFYVQVKSRNMYLFMSNKEIAVPVP